MSAPSEEPISASSAAASVKTLGPRSLRIAGQCFVLRDLAPTDREALLGLHHEVFGSAASPEWYRWKYQAGAAQGVGLWLEGRLVAHAAGVPRWVRRDGAWHHDLQIGDVMVAPHWRGVLTRHGPFFHVCQALYDSRLGPDAAFSTGFGFPNLRHLRLAVRTGLAWDGGRMHQLVWPAQAAAAPKQPAWLASPPQPLARDSIEQHRTLETAWNAMLSDKALTRLGLGRRDPAHVQWRYRLRPDKPSELLVLRRRGPWPQAWAIRGVAVVTPQDGGRALHWLDWIGPVNAMGAALAMCQAHARAHGAACVSAWGSDAVLDALAATGAQSSGVAAGIGVPLASTLPHTGRPLGWWLMGGDTDFL